MFYALSSDGTMNIHTLHESHSVKSYNDIVCAQWLSMNSQEILCGRIKSIELIEKLGSLKKIKDLSITKMIGNSKQKEIFAAICDKGILILKISKSD